MRDEKARQNCRGLLTLVRVRKHPAGEWVNLILSLLPLQSAAGYGIIHSIFNS